VTAELIHNAVDLVLAAIVPIGLKIATRRSEIFPYGLHKIGTIIAATIGGMIFFTAYKIAPW
jgi:divalent metal cation (Fe/Co/Zn/Cd) transporter